MGLTTLHRLVYLIQYLFLKKKLIKVPPTIFIKDNIILCIYIFIQTKMQIVHSESKIIKIL